MIYALLSQNFVVEIYALFPQNILDWGAQTFSMMMEVMVMMPRVCGAGNDGRVPWRGLITLECRITSAREETSNLMPNLPLLTTKWN